MTSRGNRREAIFRTESDRQRFLALVAELPERFGLEVHVFVLMDNHYHLVVRTPEPNLSDAYQGSKPAPAWLDTGVVGRGCGGRSREERRRALRAYTEAPIRQGRLESRWEGMVGGVVLGGNEFARRMLKEVKRRTVNREEQTSVRRLTWCRRRAWGELVQAAEQELGRSWSRMAQDRGDWGRDGTIYVAVRHGHHRLSEVLREVGGTTYGAGAQALRRFATEVTKDRAKARFVDKMRRWLAND